MKRGWGARPLRELCDYQRGLTYTKGDEVESSNNIVLRATNIDLGTNLLDLRELRYISEKIVIPASKKLKRNSILICTASGSKNHLGKAAFIDGDYDCAFGGFMGMLTPKSVLHSKYLFYLMISDAYRDFVKSLSDGVNINNLRFEDLGTFPVPVPPVAEQHRIVARLDELFANLRTAKINVEKNVQNARALFESHLQSIFAHRNKGWATMTVDKLSTNLDYQRVPITKSKRKAGSYPYYGASGIVDYVADFIFDGNALLVSEDGANLLARTTPIAFSVTGKYWVNNHAHILKFESLATQRFVQYYLESVPLDEFIRGAAQPKLTQKALNSIPVPIPSSIDEQASVVEALDAIDTESQILERLYVKRLGALDAMKKSMLHEAFTGAL